MPSDYSMFIGITMGCPVGIGPEIILKYLCRDNDFPKYFPIVIGYFEVFEKCAKKLGVTIEIIPWRPGDVVERKRVPQRIYIYQPKGSSGSEHLEPSSLVWGEPTTGTGTAMALCIESCYDLIQRGDLAAMVTAPISKAALHMAGYTYPGHTEMLASLSGSNNFAMMMAGQKLRVTLVTIHVGLQDVPNLLNHHKIIKLITMTGDSLRNDFALPYPKMAIAALNPHAGEGGLFGNEEARIIVPAIKAARDLGWDVAGPFPPDTVFNKAVAGDFDAVICMYHDQGLIPFKLIHFEDGVNVTIGLSTVRTSVDHGTAYDIAGKGVANPSSLQAAFEMAVEIVTNRRRDKPLANNAPV